MMMHQPLFAALWATVYVLKLMSVCWPAWRVQGPRCSVAQSRDARVCIGRTQPRWTRW